jgi:hypothetical protein
MILAVVGAVAMAGAAPRDPAPVPDADFLEFLGSWHTGDDRWVDPFQVDEATGVEHGEQNQDRSSRDKRDQKSEKATPPYDGSKQSERESTLPRRDVKP